MGDQLWGWQTELEIIDDNEIILSDYNISPEGEETKAAEAVLKRV